MDEDGLEIIEMPKDSMVAKKFCPDTQSSTNEKGNDVMVLGSSNIQRLPHMRQHCPEFSFVQDVRFFSTLKTPTAKKKVKEGNIVNPKFCDLCYCYICDIPASLCVLWTRRKGPPAAPQTHCLASDRGLQTYFWESSRKRRKKKLESLKDKENEE